MKNMYKEILEAIKTDYFAKVDPAAAQRVIEKVKSMQNFNKFDAMQQLANGLDYPNLNERNLEALAWRMIERTMIYPYKVGDEVKFNNRNRVIQEIDLEDRSALLRKEERVGAVTVSLIHLYIIEQSSEKNKVTTSLQLSLF
ncbi:hypothetical protein [Bacillus cihuensis]|uniref:hypothetical protein n=1 Tax=Bacillus cihuensis TaxID=1208599 RepID=UPI00040A395A|nr:hypothetical protein [Bacillus cihuensis]